VMIIEAVTLSTVAPQKPKNMEAFAKTRKTSSDKRDLSILTTAAVEIAHNLNASAIITFSRRTSENTIQHTLSCVHTSKIHDDKRTHSLHRRK